MPAKRNTRSARNTKIESNGDFWMNDEQASPRGMKRGARAPQRTSSSTNRRSELGMEPGKGARGGRKTSPRKVGTTRTTTARGSARKPTRTTSRGRAAPARKTSRAKNGRGRAVQRRTNA